ncbi:hypothetical protein [Leifsonia sp. 71-9]|uniref:hypothetical protein n=1 Tax=Leifsonia sp. 71-9 TaxID=1895934 RepID=UPI0009268AB3|nr:hypothetical protein [Leifsonia sp. 71-9]OJX73106.1 MAG: hypothetical protein BGO91_15325 [Leifsonia sp. 71-9]
MANLTEEQRAAQRKLVGTLNRRNAMWFEPNGAFCIWRDEVAEEWGGGIPQLSEAYDALAIPYVVRVEQMIVSKRKKVGFTIVVNWEDLPCLVRWAPSFEKTIDGVRAEVEKARAAAETAQ